ncbi:MAG: IMPACT family protein [Bacteroidia bacterium]
MSLFEDVYLSIEGPGEGVFRDRGSKFLAYAFPVRTEEEVKTHVQNLKKEHHKARHWCYAFRLGADKQFFRVQDDGEPSGTAGRPILGQIQSRDLSDIVVIVVRYFGGTLLGVGGLIQAYKLAASDALDKARIIEKIIGERYTVRFPYERMNDVMKIIKDRELEQSNTDFGESCSLEIKVRRREADAVGIQFRKLEGVQLIFIGGT